MAQNKLRTNGKSTLKTINSRSIEKLTSGNVNIIMASVNEIRKEKCTDGQKKNVRTINWRIYISVNSSSVIIFIIVDRSENLLTAGWKVNQLHFFCRRRSQCISYPLISIESHLQINYLVAMMQRQIHWRMHSHKVATIDEQRLAFD